MSAISDYVAAQKQYNTALGAGIDALVASLEGVAGDISNLNKKIQELVDRGTLSDQDLADIQQLQADGAALSVKFSGAVTRAGEIDAQTPPAAPPA